MNIAAAGEYGLFWVDLVVRWLHVIVSIAWVGSSFYFMWLDARLNVPPQDPENEGVVGDLWALHGGGFYHSHRYKIAPPEIPRPLYRFKWEAYTTWLSGITLLALVYYLNADLYLVNRETGLLDAEAAIAASIGLIMAAWLAYQALCVSISSERVFVIIGISLATLSAWIAAQLFTGRGAFMQIGATLGTLMAANVFFVIMPAQRAMLRSLEAGGTPDSAMGRRAKRRSLHNNYLTLPVVFCMLSPHYPLMYGSPDNWLVLVMLLIAGGFVRHYFNLRNAGKRTVVPLAVASLIVGTLFVAVGYASHDKGTLVKSVTYSDAKSILDSRCRTCHSIAPTFPGTVGAPAGVVLDTEADVHRWAGRIHERVVVTRTMPINNITGITDAERRRIDAWFASVAKAN